MSSSVAFPDATGSNTGALTGGASAHAVLGDLDDATYVTYDALEGSTLTFGSYSPAIPGDAVIRYVAAWVRVKFLSVNKGFVLQTSLTQFDAGPPIVNLSNTRSVGITSATYQQFVGAQITDSTIDPDDITVVLLNNSNPGKALAVSTLYAECIYVEKPTLTVDTPTGTVSDTTNPTVSWTATLDTDGGAQFAVGVKIYSEAQYTDPGFDPDTSTPVTSTSFFGQDTSWKSDTALVDGDYRAYVKVYQYYHESDWEYEAFTIDVDRPGIPGFDVAPEDTAGRVLLTFSETTGDTTTDGVHIQHTNQNGEWEDIRTELGDGLVDIAEDTYYDYEAPNGTVTWRARAYHEFASGELSYSDWVEDTDTVAGGWWIKHPSRPQLNVSVELRSFPGHSRESRQSVVQPLGRTDAVAIGDTRGPQTGTVVIRCGDDDTRDNVMALASETSPVLLQAATDHHEPDRWVILGNEQVERLIDQSWSTERNITYEWTEVARPTTPMAYAGLYPDDLLFLDDDLYPH